MNPPAGMSIEEEFAAFENGAGEPADFPHHEHVRFAYEMLARCSFAESATLFRRGLRHLARKSGRPQLYHETTTLAFLAVIGERMQTTRHSSWPEFAAANPYLLEKAALRRWYPAGQLESELARKTFCLPAPTGARSIHRAVTVYTIVFCAHITWSALARRWRRMVAAGRCLDSL